MLNPTTDAFGAIHRWFGHKPPIAPNNKTMIQVKITAKHNTMTNAKVASAQIVNLQTMNFDQFCEYLSQDSTVGKADVAAVMTQFAAKLPLLVGLGTKVTVSPDGITVRPTVKGSLTQEELTAKLTARKSELLADGDTAGAAAIDVNRELKASDLKTSDLTAGLSIDFGSKFVSLFGRTAELKRVTSGVADSSEGSEGGNEQGGQGGGQGGDDDPDGGGALS